MNGENDGGREDGREDLSSAGLQRAVARRGERGVARGRMVYLML